MHMFQMAFTPEIERRIASGQVDPNFALYAAQRLQYRKRAPVIRLNEEVRGVAVLRANRSIKSGDPILLSDVRDLISMDLVESELDAGHFTLLWNGKAWHIVFDFRTGRAEAVRMIKLARQFSDAAAHSVARGYAGPSVDNLFSACELASKARLILHGSPAADSKKHKAVGSAINHWGRLGNVDADFVKVFNRLSNARSSARYDAAAEVTSPSDSEFEVVTRELDGLERSVAQLAGTSDNPSEIEEQPVAE